MTDLTSQTRLDGALLGVRPVCAQVHALHICIDPRLELLAIVQWLSSYGRKYPLLTRHDFPYPQAIAARLSGYAEHAAVRTLDAILSRPFSHENPPFAFGAPPEAMLYVADDFALRDDVFANTFLVNRAGGRESLLRFVDSLRQFFRDALFAAFYEENAPTYRAIVHHTSGRVESRDYVKELEAFYGTKQGSYTLILVPLYHSVGFGPNILVEGVRHTYNIMGPSGVEDGMPVFGSVRYFAEMQRHEFSHSYVNPLTDQYWPTTVAHFEAYASAEEAKEMVNESIIRAVTTWLAYAEGADTGDRALQRELERGFTLVPELLERIRAYAAQRDAYPTFAAFYSNLIPAFAGQGGQRYGPLGEAHPRMPT